MPKRQILTWVVTYLLLFTVFFLYYYALWHALPWPIELIMVSLNPLVMPLSILFPISLVSILGILTSFLAFLFSNIRLKLRGSKQIGFYMIFHPLIVSTYQASQAFLYGATDTPWWGWFLEGGISYILLVVIACMISNLFDYLLGRSD